MEKVEVTYGNTLRVWWSYTWRFWLFSAMLSFVLGNIANLTLYRFNILPMLGQVLFPIVFLSALAFMISTLVKNGNGTAIIVVITAFIFFVFAEELEYSAYNVFLNPFSEPRDMSEFIWLTIIFKNRLYLIVASALCLLYGMFNLQFRERFI